MRISVLVPTYQRPLPLWHCLKGIARQQRQADEVIVVTRAGDAGSERVLRRATTLGLPIRHVLVTETGGVAACNAGLVAAGGDIVAVTDDDAVPRPGWLLRIEEHFAADPRLGVLGGRDFIHQNGRLIEGSASTINRIRWFGLVVGENHLGSGPAREADIVKGVNMSIRRLALGDVRFDRRLRGQGAQVHMEYGIAMALKRAGWRIVYDPAVEVDHYPAIRYDEDQRDARAPIAIQNEAYNETLALLDYLPPARRVAFLLFAFGIGTRATPGFLQWGRLVLSGVPSPAISLIASLRGRIAAICQWRADQPRKKTARPQRRDRAAAHESSHP